MKELIPSTWGISVDKSQATETFPLRGTVFPRESDLNFIPSNGHSQPVHNLEPETTQE